MGWQEKIKRVLDEKDEVDMEKQQAIFAIEEARRELSKKDDEFQLSKKDLSQQIEAHQQKIEWFRDNQKLITQDQKNQEKRLKDLEKAKEKLKAMDDL